VRNVLSALGVAFALGGSALGVLFPRGGVAVAAVVLACVGLALFVVAWWEPPTVALFWRLIRRWVA
jgi:hypothetical protein